MNSRIFSIRCACALVVVFICVISVIAQENNDNREFDIGKVREEVEKQPYKMSNDSSDAVSKAEGNKESFAAIIARIAGWLMLLIFIMVALLWILRKTGIIGASRIGGGAMDVLEALPLGHGKTLVLVRMMDKVLVLAQSSQSVEVIDKIEGEKALEIISSSRGEQSVIPFKDMVQSFIAKTKK